MDRYRHALVAAVRQDLAEARGTARAALAVAESARGAAHDRQRVVQDAYATCLNQLAEARDAARRDIQRRYQLATARLAGDVANSAAGAAEWGEAEEAYRDSAARAAGEVSRSEQDAAASDRWASAAAAQVLDVDREAARLWDRLRRLGVPGLGASPDPAPVEILPRVARPAQSRTLLTRAAFRIDDAVRPVGRRPLPRWALPLLPLVGALVATLTALLAAGLVTFAGTGVWGGTVLRTAGWAVFAVAPSAGVPVVALAAHRHLQARLDIGGIALTLLGGMIASAMMSLAFITTR